MLEAPVSAASRGDESIPRIQLRAGDDRQRGRVWTSTDDDGDGNGCVTGHSDGIPIPPRRAIELRRDPFRGRFIIDRDEEPRVHLRAYTDLDEFGSISYESSQPIHHRLRAVPSAGEPVRWIVTFRTRASDHVYPDLSASWEDPSGCGRDEGSFVFHLAEQE